MKNRLYLSNLSQRNKPNKAVSISPLVEEHKPSLISQLMDKKKDASCSLNHHQCNHGMAIEGIKRGQELTNQLRDALGFAAATEPISKLFHGIDSSLNNALSGLQYGTCIASGSKINERKKNSLEEDNHGVHLRRYIINPNMATKQYFVESEHLLSNCLCFLILVSIVNSFQCSHCF